MTYVLDISDTDWDSEVMASEIPVIVDFWATWCGPCRQVQPILQQIADEHPEVKVVKMDIDANHETAQRYSVMSVPTMLVFKGGEVVQTVVGAKPKRTLERLLVDDVA